MKKTKTLLEQVENIVKQNKTCEPENAVGLEFIDINKSIEKMLIEKSKEVNKKKENIFCVQFRKDSSINFPLMV